MNNYFKENISTLAKLRKTQPRLFKEFTQSYAGTYCTLISVHHSADCSMTCALAYGMDTMARLQDMPAVDYYRD